MVVIDIVVVVDVIVVVVVVVVVVVARCNLSWCFLWHTQLL